MAPKIIRQFIRKAGLQAQYIKGAIESRTMGSARCRIFQSKEFNYYENMDKAARIER